MLLSDRKVVIAHGVQKRQDSVFLEYGKQFEKLSEGDFTDFWCVYLISLAYEQFIRSDRHKSLLTDCASEIADFRLQYNNARIPEFKKKLTLKEIIAWALEAVNRIKPRVSWTPPGDAGQFDFTLDIAPPASTATGKSSGAILPPQIAYSGVSGSSIQ